MEHIVIAKAQPAGAKLSLEKIVPNSVAFIAQGYHLLRVVYIKRNTSCIEVLYFFSMFLKNPSGTFSTVD